MKSYTKTLVLVLGTCLLASACAKKKSAKRAVPGPTPGFGAVNNSRNLPGLDNDQQPRTASGALDNFDDESIGQQRDERLSQEQVSPLAPMPSAGPEMQPQVVQPQIQTHDGTPADAEIANGSNNNEKCGTAYRANSELWFPGLPYAPSPARICTGSGGGDVKEEQLYKCEAANGYVYTDGRQDGLMALVANNFNKLPKYMDHASRRLARRIQDVKVESNLLNVGTVSVRIALAAGRGANGQTRYNHIRLRGNMKKSGRTKLQAIDVGRKANYEGELTCADANGGCDNAILRIDQIIQPREEAQVKGKGAKVAHRASNHRKAGIGAVAFIVIRNGDAHVTMSDQERLGYSRLTNQVQSQFAHYLSNTVNNTCLNIMSDVKHGHRKLDKCAYRRLLEQCGRSQFKSPAATDFVLSSWAVIYGRAGFEFSIQDNGGERLSIRGPLVATNATPMWSRPLKLSGRMAGRIETALLIANDGGGNLNLQLNFAGGDKAQSRISVSSMSDDVRLGAQSSNVSTSAQIPTVDVKTLAEQRDVEQNVQAEGEVVVDEEAAANAPTAQVAPPLAQPAPEAQAQQQQEEAAAQAARATPAPSTEVTQGAAPGAGAVTGTQTIPEPDETGATLQGTEIAPPPGLAPENQGQAGQGPPLD